MCFSGLFVKQYSLVYVNWILVLNRCILHTLADALIVLCRKFDFQRMHKSPTQIRYNLTDSFTMKTYIINLLWLYNKFLPMLCLNYRSVFFYLLCFLRLEKQLCKKKEQFSTKTEKCRQMITKRQIEKNLFWFCLTWCSSKETR